MHANSSGCFTDVDGSVHLSGLQTLQTRHSYQKKCVTSTSVTKQDPLKIGLPKIDPPPCPPLTFCLYKKTLVKGKLHQRSKKMQGEKKENSQGRQKKIFFSHKPSQRTFSSSSRVINNILSHVLWGVLQILKPPPGGRSQLSPEKEHRSQTSWNQKVDDIVSLTTNQKDVHKLIKTPQSPLTLSLKILKAFGEFESFKY